MAWLICFCVFAAVIIVALYLRKIHGFLIDERTPPNLPSLPIIGSLLSLRTDSPPHIFFQQLQKKYGDIYSLMMGSHKVIIVNNHHHAKEVLLKKGKIFAGRPRTVSNLYQSEISNKKLNPFCCYRTRWRVLEWWVTRNEVIFKIPLFKVTTDILTRNGKDIAFADYSATWKFHRKIVHGALCMFGEGTASIEKISMWKIYKHLI